jgi:hypothetical protein
MIFFIPLKNNILILYIFQITCLRYFGVFSYKYVLINIDKLPISIYIQKGVNNYGKYR